MNDSQALDLQDFCYSVNEKRAQFPYGLVVIGHSITDLIAHLQQFIAGEPCKFYKTLKISDATTQVNLDEINDLELTVENITQLIENGGLINWKNFYQGSKAIKLPFHAFSRKIYWPQPVQIAYYPVISKVILLDEPYLACESILVLSDHPFLKDHILNDDIVLPGSFYVDFLLRSLQFLNIESDYSIQEISIQKMLKLDLNAKIKFRIHFFREKAEYRCEIYSKMLEDSKKHKQDWSRFVMARAIRKKSLNFMAESTIEFINNEFSPADFYQAYQTIGIHYGNYFQCIKKLRVEREICTALLESTDTINADQGKWFFN